MFILLLATIIQRSVGFGRGILFCRWLSPEILGEWEMAYSFLLLAAPLAVLGVPGTFGRYVEHYRQRSHLHTFLRRTTAWILGCCLIAVGGLQWFTPQVSQVIFGSSDHENLVAGLNLCLVAIIIHHTLTALFTALRMIRIVAAMNFAQSGLFAIVSLGMIWVTPGVSSILYGYGIACFSASIGAIFWTWPEWKGSARNQSEPVPELIPHSQFWMKLFRFAFFVWITNMLAHLFGIIDRTMIIHMSGFEPSEALQQVGHYHSSRLVPMLVVSFAGLLSGLVMPHMSHDWEAGRRDLVSDRLNFTLKLTGLGMLAFGVGVLMFSPLLFHVILQGKYSDGLAVLPWTLTGCVWYGIYEVAHNYLWCAEKAKRATVPLAVGLAANILLNLLLLPVWGLLGAVVATGLSTLLCLLLTLILNRQTGMRIAGGTWLAVLAPGSLTLGSVASMVTLLLLTAGALGTQILFNENERQEIKKIILNALSKLPRATGRRWSTTGGA